MINRRDFIGTGIAGLALMQKAGAASTPPPRQVFPLNHNWLYGGRNVAGATAPGFDDAPFQRVTLPHTNVMLPWHSFDETSYQFISIYRRHFRLPSGTQGQRVFVDFEGAMTAATVTINAHKFEEFRGGYTPFSFELTPHLNWTGDNVIAVELDSTERPDIPPYGGSVDYLTFGGIYREVSLRVVPQSFIENVFARPTNVLSATRGLDVEVFLNGGQPATSIHVELRDGARVIATQTSASNIVRFQNLASTELWTLDKPKLYDVIVQAGNDEYRTRIGFREAKFTAEGFHLNGERIKLRGLDRHQMFPYIGNAAPARMQSRDVQILKDIHTNVVRNFALPAVAPLPQRLR